MLLPECNKQQSLALSFGGVDPKNSQGVPPFRSYKMNCLKSASLGLVFLASACGIAFAQSGAMTSDKMGAKPMAMSMSKMDMKKMGHCKSMSNHKMMKNRSCKKMMKMNPDMMKGDAMMDKGNAPK